MSTADFRRFRAECLELYQDGEYEQAFKLINLRAGEFPERASTLIFWKICMAALMGEIESALRLFAEALDQGYWWPEQMLRGDPDLATLQNLPEFEQLLAVSEARYQAALAISNPAMLKFLPAQTPAKRMPLLIVLHGHNGTGAETAEYWKALTDQGWLVAVAQSSQPLGAQTYTWANHSVAEEEIRKHFSDLSEIHPIDPQRIVLAGFSQGGGLAIRLCLTGAIPACSFIAVAPYLRDAAGLAEQLAAHGKKDLRGYLITGAEDPHQEMFGQIEDLLHACEVSYQREEHPGLGHDYPPDWEQALARAMAFILK
jgi:predicted esterase